MPQLEMEKLEKESSSAAIQAAISACIAAEMRNGKDQKQATAMCQEMARSKTTPTPGGA